MTYHQEYYLKNRTSQLRKQRERRKKNREKVREIERKSQAKRYAEDPAARRRYHRLWRKKNIIKERRRERKSRREYVRRNKEKIQQEKRAQLLRLYGLTPAQFQKMEESQSGKCAICDTKTKLCVDHDHQSGCVRGLLCRLCNVGLGIFKDSEDRLLRAISYLQHGPSKG